MTLKMKQAIEVSQLKRSGNYEWICRINRCIVQVGDMNSVVYEGVRYPVEWTSEATWVLTLPITMKAKEKHSGQD